jgi:O-antigen/teichoic acid export membrane protein
LDNTAITKRTAQAVGWLSLSRLAAKGIDFCLLLILGRALLPADFGLVALAMTLVVMLDAISELPVAQAIVRMSDPTREHYDTAFTLATIRAVVLGSACMALAWPFATFYNDTRLIDLILLLSLAFMSRGLVSPRLAHYARNLDFRRDFIIDMAGKVMSLVCAGTVALVFRSYWAIAAGTVSYWLTTVTASYIVAPYRPRLTLRHAESFGRFLGWSTAAQMVNAINWQSEKLVLGRFAAATEVGQFSMGSDLANLPTRILVAPLLVALLPAFSLIRDDAERLKSSYLRVLRSVTVVGIPILVFLCIVAPSATTLLLGPKWTEAAFGLQVLSLASIPAMFVAMISPLAMALDQTHLFFRRNLYELFIKIPMMTAGAMLGGFNGFLFATAASAVITNLMTMALVQRLVGISVIQQIGAAWRTYASLIPACAFLIPAQIWLTGLHSWQLFGLGFTLSVAGVIFLVTDMALWAWCGRPDGLESIVAPQLRRVLSRMKGLLDRGHPL